MKFRVRAGFTLFHGEHAYDAAFAHMCGHTPGRGSYAAGAVVELTHEQVSALDARQLGMLEGADAEGSAALRGIEPTPPPPSAQVSDGPRPSVTVVYPPVPETLPAGFHWRRDPP